MDASTYFKPLLADHNIIFLEANTLSCYKPSAGNNNTLPFVCLSDVVK
jgi:hypothetical protein